jgi:glutamate/tyrosine decarboxylase-like PLP-dependent enzyme
VLPRNKGDWDQIRSELVNLKKLDFDGLKGRLPGYLYFHNDDVLKVQREAYSEYILENGLGAGHAYMSLESMLRDIYDMGLSLFNAPLNAGATFTSGGTASVFDAVKSARDRERKRRGEKYGLYNVVTPYSSHPCLNKAGQLLDVKIRRTNLGEDRRGSVAELASAIDDDTVMIYASAPAYPFGLFDPIEAIAELALSRNLWLHIDACWGGFLSPFAKTLGYDIPKWDFSVPGVTSISADIHKHGYGVKGASLLMFRDEALREFEQFEFSDWHRGAYFTPSIAGSSPGGAIAAAYAVMKYLGYEGYLEITKRTMEATKRWIDGVNKIPGLECFSSSPESSIFGFYSTDDAVCILAVAERMRARGWLPGLNRDPYAIQQGVTSVHYPIVDEYVTDLGDAVNLVRRTGERGRFDEHTYGGGHGS